MAQNDALTFNVKFIEDPNQNIEALSKQLEQKLKSITIKLDAKNIDVTGVSGQFTNVLNEIKKGFEELGKIGSSNGLSGLGRTINGVVENLSTLSNELVKLNSGLSTSLTNAITEAMKNSSGAIKDTIQEVNNLKNALDDVTSKVVKSVGQASKNAKNDSVGFFPVADKGGMINAYAKAIDEVTEKLEKARARQVNFSDIQDVNKITTVYQMWGREIQNLENQLNSLYQAMGKAATMRGFNEILAPISQPYSKNERSFIEQQLNAAFGQPKYDFAGMEKARQEYSSISNTAKELYDVMMRINSTPALKHLADSGNSLFERLKAVRQELMNISTTGVTSKGLNADEFLKSLDFKSLESELAKFISSAKNQFKELDRAAAESKKKIEQTQVKNNKNSAEAELQRLKKLMQEVNAIQAKSPKLQIEGVDRAKQELQALIDLMDKAKKEGTSISGINMGRWSAENANRTIAELVQNERSAAIAASQHALEQQRMEQAVANANARFSQQSQVLSDLRSMAAQYLSVWGFWNIAKEVANITGELQLQQKSLEVIIGSSGQAQELFTSVKNLSQMSPFTFQDLLKSTRQLAAFGVETKDLYGTMKSLSDLGAGLNVDVQRLILAYGHVKSAGVLSGIQRRQFETAGINITGEIAKLYNERYKRAGSDERVTNADIFKRITKREISFEDVEQAINRLTGPGGRFYEMQLKQYDTLGGKLRNLKNNYNIMLDEIGKSYMGVLTGTVDAFNSMMENWRTWGKLIKSVTLALVAAKVANIAFGKSWSAHNAAALSRRASTIEERQIAAVNTGMPGKFYPRVGSVGHQQLAMPYANTINGSEMTRYQKISAALYRNVSQGAANAILREQGLNDVYRARIMRMNELANSAKRLERIRGQMQLGIERLSWSARGFFNTMRAGAAALISNPMTWIAAAVAGFTALSSKASEIKEMRENTVNRVTESTREDIKEIDKALNDISEQYFTKSKTGETIFDINAVSGNIESLFNDLDQALQKFDPLYKGHILDYKMIDDDKERVLAMFDDLESAKVGKRALKESISGIMTANSESGYEGTTWYRPDTYKWDTAIDEAKEYQAELTKVRGEVMAHVEEISNIFIDAQRRGLGDSAEKAADEVSRMMREYDISFEEALQQYIEQGGKLYIKTKKFEIDTSDMQEKLDSFSEKAQGMVKAVNAKMKSMFRKNASIGEVASYLQESINAIFSVDGKEVTDPAAVANLQQEIMKEFSPPEGASATVAERWKESIGAALDKVNTDLAQAKLNEVIKLSLDMGLINGDSSASEIISTIEPQMKAYFDAVVSKIDDPAQKARVQAAFDKFWTGFTHNPKPAIQKFDQAWKRVWDRVSDPNDPRFKLKKTFSVIFNASTDTKGFWSDLTKEISRLKEDAQKSIKSFTVLQKVGINLDLAYNTATAKAMLTKLAQAMLPIREKNVDLFMQMYNEAFVPLKKFVDGVESAEKLGRNVTGDAYDKAQKQNEKAQKARDAEQRRREAADRKAKAAAEKARNEAERKEQKEWDRDLKNRRDMVSRLEEARREYKTWLGKGANETNAAAKVIDTFKEWGLVGKGKLFEESDLKDINNYDKILDKIKAKIDEMKPRSKKEGRAEQLDDLYQLLAKAQTNLETTIFDERQADILSEMESTIERLTKKWEIYNSVLEKTGDTNLAGTLAGLSELDRGYDKLKGSLEEYIDRYVSMYMQNAPMDPQTISSLRRVDFSKVINLDEKGIERYVRDTFGVLGEEGSLEMIERIKAVVALVKSYKKASDNSHKSAIDAYSNAISSAMDYESQIQRVNSKLEEQIKLINSLDELTPEQKNVAIEIEASRAEIKKLELGGSYKKFFDGIFDEPMSQMEAMRTVLEGAYARALRSGAISAEDYAKKIEEIDKVMREATINNPEAWWNKGFFDNRTQEQRQNEMRDRGNALYRHGSDLYQQAIQNGDQKGAKDALEMMQKGKSMVEGANKAAIAMAIIDKVVHNIDKAIQGTIKAFGYLTEALAALGEENDTMAAIGDYLNTLGEMSGHVASSWDSFKSGDYVGAGVEAFGAITSLITGFSQAHDNRLQRKIDHIKEDTAKMSNTLESIRSLRERQLGYDNGNMRTRMASMYGITDYGDFITNRFMNGNSAAAAMFDYYTRYRGGSGYEQELKLLEEQRQKLIEMYNLEDRKKKKNKEELEEYQTQIADLDEQIMFFTEDLANQLWGIDLKGWADQLGDALMTAFENGSSAAAAFKDTVQDIMRGVVKNMLTVGIIEPALENLRVKLFGNNGNGGLFDPNNPKGSMGAVLNGLSNWFETEGPQLMDAANEFYNGADNMMRQILGYGMRENEKSTNTVNSISSAASEETMGIVAGYLSRLSQDVSVQRIMQEMFVNGSWPSYIEQVTSVNNSISSIDRSTTAMMEMMRDGTGALYERVENMSRRLDNFANGIDRIAVM